MSRFRLLRLMLAAFVLSLVPAASHAGVFISVGFAPPVLPVYDVPPCPDPGWIWTPGYWAYGPDGYYWVPGAWVPAPYDGALWTPGYWGWSGGLYVWHPGYWGEHVGYYGGINYGGGYFGIGFVGGEWRGHDFMYNTAVMRVGPGIHHTYMDRGAMDRAYVDRGSRAAFNGGPGGINHAPGAAERMADRDRHSGFTSFQNSHQNAAMGDRSSYFRNNNGRPGRMATDRPMGWNNNGGQQQRQQGQQMQMQNQRGQQQMQQQQQQNFQRQQQQQQGQQQNFQRQQQQMQNQQQNFQRQQQQMQGQQQNFQRQQQQMQGQQQQRMQQGQQQMQQRGQQQGQQQHQQQPQAQHSSGGSKPSAQSQQRSGNGSGEHDHR